ncbi:hypothetical protein B566_EDAN004696 [Ephemera danica]|nr:hypothetical protein B566_EDAN004696 [Ephemera danica]
MHVSHYEVTLVIQLRGDFGEPRQNFTRSWADYERGFGDLRAEFWSGLRFLHRATNIASMRLRVELSDFEGNTTNAEYSVFRVLGPVTQYKLRVGGYSGNASDSLSAHDKVAFSTVDQDNDEAPACCPCAPTYGGGWWFYSCFEANLNGEYHEAGEDNTYFRGIIWEHWRGDYSLATAQMKIRPLDFEPR